MILPALLKKEIKEIIRDPVTLGTAIFLPLVMLFIFGYAISLDVEDISMAVYDQDRTQESERLIEAFTASGYFLPEYRLDSLKEIDELLNRGKAKMAIIIPPDFSRDINSFRKTNVQILLDGSYSATAMIVSSYASAIVNSYSMSLLNRYLNQRGLRIERPIGIIPRVSV